MGVEFAFQCSGVLQTDSPTWSNTYEIFIASAVGRLRNSPGRLFQRLETQTDA